ncbi:unnamed protein product [Oppiella nova]|uniref:Uncharacterized protein n=1 Tax=Oppiella nova TaxID=334625 RepID=A0A7R9MAR9_9ACAR|nr:unnamed protein product [Oppiella nova]CAG2172661.1 unnamed protein product [Oppiella nova]
MTKHLFRRDDENDENFCDYRQTITLFQLKPSYRRGQLGYPSYPSYSSYNRFEPQITSLLTQTDETSDKL